MSPLPSNIVSLRQFYHCASGLLPLPVNWGQAAAAVISSEPLISLPCPALHPAENAVHATIRGREFVRAVDFLSCPAPHPAENAVHATIQSRDFVRTEPLISYLALHWTPPRMPSTPQFGLTLFPMCGQLLISSLILRWDAVMGIF
ncbi:hypothetical protein MVEN_00106500 [Mycena venus]|uniref:Uncharacterized protein n=1 Tax=Mycena venus TaxID=2733690 RepID=A0A8H6Z4K3_9AGAR|nr:hypothetical protein MVEN_00106500 [Mycena venus]